MNEGEVQQISSPAKLYDTPVNKFVARFIGNPAMNFLRCAIEEDSRALSASGVEVHLDERQAVGLQGSSDRQVWLGVRSEHLRLVNAEDAKAQSWLSGRVELVEHLGSALEIELELASREHVVVQLDRRANLASDDIMTLAIDAPNVHAFDSASERNLVA